jgi:DNA-binding MarR family transcriptional regulator
VSRRPPARGERRARLLAVTAQGQQLRDQVRSAIRSAEQPLLATLPAVERTAFLRALQQLTAKIVSS